MITRVSYTFKLQEFGSYFALSLMSCGQKTSSQAENNAGRCRQAGRGISRIRILRAQQQISHFDSGIDPSEDPGRH